MMPIYKKEITVKALQNSGQTPRDVLVCESILISIANIVKLIKKVITLIIITVITHSAGHI